MFDRFDQRLRRSRPGSVLILVVALLVLLALLGTAYINTAQTDRYSSQQNSFNTEIDLLLQGVENITQSGVAASVFGTTAAAPNTPVFHYPTTSPSTPNAYAVSDYPGNPQSGFIADRYPTAQYPTLPVALGNRPLWNFVTSLPSKQTYETFETPYVNTAGTGITHPTPPTNTYHVRSQTYPTDSQMSPTSLSWSVSGGGGAQNVTYPAFDFQQTTSGVPAGNPPTTTTYTVLAADADGDGIADAGLFRLPIGQINGVTYYGGVRIVDNAAAINAAIAWKPYDAGTVLPGNFFPTNIDLFDLLVSGDQAANFDTFNTNDRLKDALASAPTLIPAYDDSGALRSDFSFATKYEAFWMQLGRRLGNPGYNTATDKFLALPTSEMQTMAYRFVLHNPSGQSSSALEKDLPNSCFAGTPSSPYSPSNWLNWAETNFDFANAAATVPLRSMLVTQNGVSNFTFSKLPARGAWDNTLKYNFGDWVTFTDNAYTDPVSHAVETVTRSYVCMQQNTGNSPQTGVSTAYWEPQSWSSGPTKASANTATFGQLWPAYYSAMTDAPLTATSLGTTLGMTAMFKPSIRTVNYPASNFPWEISGQGNGTPGFPQMQLCAALAAINTLQLRTPSPNPGTTAPLSKTISITDANGTPAYNITVYGSAPQPFITEVYANTHDGGDPTMAYVAVELYNPYPFDIPLNGWQLATIKRPGTGLNQLTVTSLPSTVGAGTTSWATTGPVVPKNGFIVLASSKTPPAAISGLPTATVGGSPALIELPDLASALDSELVLLRPVSATPGTPPAFFTGGGTATVPVDAYDFTGLPQTDADPGHEWHYIRPSDPSFGKAWHFVYPGPIYNGNTGPMSPRQAGTYATVGSNTSPQTTTLASLGKMDPSTLITPTASESSYIDRPLQINNTSFPGPNMATTSANLFPFGGFARNVDLLQVTFIGAYQVTSLDNTKLYELNSLPSDSALANDAPENQDPHAVTSIEFGRENVGRFCPIHWADTVDATGKPVSPTEIDATLTSPPWDDFIYPFVPTTAAPTAPVYWPTPTQYYWTQRLFDYVTVQSPQDDYLPDVDPAAYPATPAPKPVANVSSTVANAQLSNTPPSATEETVPVHGRININTANWRVLATLPFVDGVQFGASPNTAAQEAEQIAQSIVYYRDVDDKTVANPMPPATPGHPHGAFQSIFELNNVPISVPGPLPQGTLIRTVLSDTPTTNVLLNVPGQHASNVDGDLSPNSATAGADQVYGDFENQNLALNRISNLITTRSDSFTAYVIVQGWRNAGTSSPELVAQRRGAFIIDRSTITPTNNTQPGITNVPTN